MLPRKTIGGASCTVTEVRVSGSAGVLSCKMDARGQAVPPSISGTMPLHTVGQTMASQLMAKCDLHLHLGMGMDNHQHKWCFTDPTGHLFK